MGSFKVENSFEELCQQLPAEMFYNSADVYVKLQNDAGTISKIVQRSAVNLYDVSYDGNPVIEMYPHPDLNSVIEELFRMNPDLKFKLQYCAGTYYLDVWMDKVDPHQWSVTKWPDVEAPIPEQAFLWFLLKLIRESKKAKK